MPQQYSAGSCNQQRTPMDYAQPERLPGHAFIGAGGGPGKERSCAWKAACYNTFAQRTLGVTLPTLPTLVGPTLDHIFLARPPRITARHTPALAHTRSLRTDKALPKQWGLHVFS